MSDLRPSRFVLSTAVVLTLLLGLIGSISPAASAQVATQGAHPMSGVGVNPVIQLAGTPTNATFILIVRLIAARSLCSMPLLNRTLVL